MSELHGNVEIRLAGEVILRGYYSPGSPPDFMLSRVMSRKWNGMTLWRNDVSDVTQIGVHNGTIVGKSASGLFILDVSDKQPKAVFYPSDTDWQAALNQRGITVGMDELQTPHALVSTRPVAELKPSEYRIAPQLGISDASLAWIILVAGLVVPLALARARSIGHAAKWISLAWGVILGLICCYVSPSASLIALLGVPVIYFYLGRSRDRKRADAALGRLMG